MATLFELDDLWKDWLETRPPIIQELGKKLPPNKLYRLKPDGHRVQISAYSEDGTVMVNITGQFNLIVFERTVFGIPPELLEECDLPNDDEMLGVALTKQADVLEYLDMMRERIRAQ